MPVGEISDKLSEKLASVLPSNALSDVKMGDCPIFGSKSLRRRIRGVSVDLGVFHGFYSPYNETNYPRRAQMLIKFIIAKVFAVLAILAMAKQIEKMMDKEAQATQK